MAIFGRDRKPGPARAGLIVYAKDLGRVARFYEAIGSMDRLWESDELVVLQSPDIQLLVHRLPRDLADEVEIASPPQRRDGAALRFFLTVEDLGKTAERAVLLGGAVFDDRTPARGFDVCTAMDPEGNLLQLRRPDD